MSFFPWKPEYSVKVAEIDAQHQKLVALLNALYEAMQSGKGRLVVGPAVNGLIDYTKTHFATEERLMQAAGYPGLPAHKKQHDEFVAKVKEFQTQLESGQASLTIQVSNFLKDWLINHIQNTDQLYSSTLNSKGFR